MQFNIEKVLVSLSRDRPVFHSEKDFQFALAWKIHEMYPRAQVRLEKSVVMDGEGDLHHVDIFILMGGKRYAVEVKYTTRKLSCTINGERYCLKNHAAQDIRRYDFLKDVEVLEKIIKNKIADIGFAIFLTNDPGYWNKPRKEHTVDKMFRLHDERIIKGKLQWINASKGTMRNREKPIQLNYTYHVKWKLYSYIHEKVCKEATFKYLILQVPPLSRESN